MKMKRIAVTSLFYPICATQNGLLKHLLYQMLKGLDSDIC
jgi:hypothetical protein